MMDSSTRTGGSAAPNVGPGTPEAVQPPMAAEALGNTPVDQTLLTARPPRVWERTALIFADVVLVAAAVAAVVWSMIALQG